MTKSFDRFSFDRVDNIVGKGENAGFHYCLLFPQCSQKASEILPGVVWERINPFLNKPWF